MGGDRASAEMCATSRVRARPIRSARRSVLMVQGGPGWRLEFGCDCEAGRSLEPRKSEKEVWRGGERVGEGARAKGRRRAVGRAVRRRRSRTSHGKVFFAGRRPLRCEVWRERARLPRPPLGSLSPGRGAGVAPYLPIVATISADAVPRKSFFHVSAGPHYSITTRLLSVFPLTPTNLYRGSSSVRTTSGKFYGYLMINERDRKKQNACALLGPQSIPRPELQIPMG